LPWPRVNLAKFKNYISKYLGMVVFILGIVDILAGTSLFFARWDFLVSICWFASAFVLAKAVLFIKSPASIVDLAAVVIAVLALTGVMYNWITYIAVLWWLQKGIGSFF